MALHNRADRNHRIRTVSELSASSPGSIVSRSVKAVSIGSKLQDTNSIQNDDENIKQNNNKLIIYISFSLILLIFVVSFILYFVNTINGITLLILNLFIILICIFLGYYFHKILNVYEMHINSLENRIYELQNYINDNNKYNNKNKPSNQFKSSLPPIPKHIFNPSHSPPTYNKIPSHSHASNHTNNKNVDLLQGFRNGELSQHLRHSSPNDLVSMLPLISMCIQLLPFGMNREKQHLLNILKTRSESNKFIAQQMHYFLFSYFDQYDIRCLFQKNKIMKYVMQTINYYNNMNNMKGRNNNNNKHISIENSSNWAEITENPLVYENKGGSLTPDQHRQHKHKQYVQQLEAFPSYDPNLNAMQVQFDENLSIEYDDVDPIRLYRLAIDNNLKPGCHININEKYFNHFYDPIYGIANVQQLIIKKQLNSNAKPYLIECYTENNKLCSTFILKKGDDLRKDAAVLQMFRFMNLLWKENSCLAHVLCYKCIPFGNDIGIIELIADCTELKHINTINQQLLSKNITNLINESAGSFVASFVLGIRDRHDENILIRTCDCTLFHIDFGFLFGEKAGNNMVYGGDTAKLAITSSLQKIMDKYKQNGWNEFVHLACSAWCILREHYQEILDFTRVLFGFTKSIEDIDIFLKDTLKIDKTDVEAKNYMQQKLINAPKKLKTKIKNKVHNIAQQIKI